MKKNIPWIVALVALAMVMLMATGTLSIKCDSDELDVGEAVEDFGDDVEDVTDEITED